MHGTSIFSQIFTKNDSLMKYVNIGIGPKRGVECLNASEVYKPYYYLQTLIVIWYIFVGTGHILLLEISTLSKYELGKEFNDPYNVRLFMFFASITAMASFLFWLHFW